MYRQYLSRLSAASWLMKLAAVPVGVATARLSAMAVTAATDGDVGRTLTLGLALLAVFVCSKAVMTLAETKYKLAAEKRLHQCRTLTYSRYLSRPMSDLGDESVGESHEKLSDDLNRVTGRQLDLLPSFWTALLTAVVYAAVIAYGSWALAAVMIVISLLQFIPPVIVTRYLEGNYRDCREIEAKITDHTVSGLKGFAEIKLFGLGGWWDKKMAEYHKEYLKIGYGSDFAGTVESSMFTFLDSVLRFGSYAAAGLFVLYGKASYETAIAAVALSSGLYGGVKTVFSSIPGFAVAKAAAGRLKPVMSDTGSASETPEDTRIRFDKVSYAAGDKTILSAASADIDASKIVLIKGENGAGKSTLFRLALGMVKPDSGSIALGGAAPESLSPGCFPRKVFCLPQEDAGFGMTPEKLYAALGCPEATETAKYMGLAPEPLGRDTGDLSGGERKKAYLAAAFALDPDILLLDEPTNSLDAEGISALAGMIRKRKERGRGAVIITHGGVFDMIADRILTLEKGAITDER